MATYTTFLNLEKPSTSERLDVLKINSNWDKIDAGVSALNSQLIEYTTMTSGTNLNSLTAKKNYMVGNISQMTNAPTGCGTSGFFYVDKNSSYVLQKFFGNLGSAHRFSYDGGSTWTDWFDINSQIGSDTKWISVPASGATTATMSSRGLWLFYRVYRPTIVFIRTNGNVELVVGESQDLTFSLSGSTLTITNPATWAINCWVLG